MRSIYRVIQLGYGPSKIRPGCDTLELHTAQLQRGADSENTGGAVLPGGDLPGIPNAGVPRCGEIVPAHEIAPEKVTEKEEVIWPGLSGAGTGRVSG